MLELDSSMMRCFFMIQSLVTSNLFCYDKIDLNDQNLGEYK